MIASILCKSCCSEFYVDASEITETGRFVRCSVCEYEWLASITDLKISDSGVNAVEDVAVQRISILQKFLGLAMIVLVIFVASPYVAAFRAWIEFDVLRRESVYDGIILEDIRYNVEEIGDVSGDARKRWLSIALHLSNKSSDVKMLDNIEIKGLDLNRRDVLHNIFAANESILPNSKLKLIVRIPIDDQAVPSYLKIKHNAHKCNSGEEYITAISCDRKSLLRHPLG